MPHNTASFLTWTAPSSGSFYIAVRGFDPSQHGGYSLPLRAATPGGPGGACAPGGSTLSNGHGSISFTDAQYQNSATCGWHISCPVGTRATVTFRASTLSRVSTLSECTRVVPARARSLVSLLGRSLKTRVNAASTPLGRPC